MTLCIGIDGCRGGWLSVAWNGATDSHPIIRVLPSIRAVTLDPSDIVAIDIPIGFMDVAVEGGREAEKEARRQLPGKSSSVFSAPCRAALSASDHSEASALNRANSSAPGIGLSRQSAAIIPKMREVDQFISPARQLQFFETHPELIFSIMNGGKPVLSKKRRLAGRNERIHLLRLNGFPVDHARQNIPSRGQWAWDDLIDACACAWSARRILEGRSLRFPAAPPRDARGLRMEINA